MRLVVIVSLGGLFYIFTQIPKPNPNYNKDYKMSGTGAGGTPRRVFSGASKNLTTTTTTATSNNVADVS